ncbi:MAG: transposase family protein [Myxococcota bacterium]
MEDAELLKLWRALNRPSPQKFAAELRKRSIKATTQDAKDIIDLQDSKQLFAPPPRYTGNITATSPDERWAMDIMVFDRPSREGIRSVLVAQDIFSRFAWIQPIQKGTSQEAVQEALLTLLEKAVPRKPSELITDRDAIFMSAGFAKFVQKLGIDSLTFAKARNDIGTVDRLIGVLKEAMAQEQVDARSGDWDTEMLRKVVAGHNMIGHAALTGAAPREVEGNDHLVFFLRRRNLQRRAHNAQRRNDKAEKLQELGGFRTLVKRRGGLPRRRFQPTWSDQVRLVGAISNGAVSDAETNQRFPLSEVLPVANLRKTDSGARAGKQRTDTLERQRRTMEEFATEVHKFLDTRPSRSAPACSRLWR